MTCFLSQKRCAAFLGVSMRTVQNWDNGQRRVPWSVVRLLRLLRLGDLGALEDGWEGFKLVRGKLFTPDGRAFQQSDMRRWWMTVEHAHLFLKRYEDEARGVGRSPALTLQPEVVEARVLVEALPPPVEAEARLTALLAASMRTALLELMPAMQADQLAFREASSAVRAAGARGGADLRERSELLAGLVFSKTSTTSI